jgi:hypothetical protein
MGANEQKMTKEIAIEQVYIRVNGGILSTENKVKREDIENYLLATVLWAWGIDFQERLDRSLRNKRYGVADKTSFDDVTVTQLLSPQYDETKQQYYVEVGNIANVGGNTYFEIAPLHGFQPIYKIEKRSDLAGLGDIADSFNFAYFLRLKDLEPRVYFTNLKNCGDCKLEVTTNIDLSKIADSDILPIPNSKKMLVIDKVCDFFLNQKLLLQDNRFDEIDQKVQ